jgi:hypothetical protein
MGPSYPPVGSPEPLCTVPDERVGPLQRDSFFPPPAVLSLLSSLHPLRNVFFARSHAGTRLLRTERGQQAGGALSSVFIGTR